MQAKGKWKTEREGRIVLENKEERKKDGQRGE